MPRHYSGKVIELVEISTDNAKGGPENRPAFCVV
jgi:hypothetical protein